MPDVADEVAGATVPKRGRPASGADGAIVAAALEIIEKDGLAHLTTKEVARRAGVSEASVFYHFGDKMSLLRSVVLAGLAPLERFEPSQIADDSKEPLATTLVEIAVAFESFFDSALPIMAAVQGDPELRREFAEGLVERDLGPHRGVRFLASLLDALRHSGRVGDGFDAEAIAAMLVGATFLRAWARHLGSELSERLPRAELIAKSLAGLVEAPPAD